jgi:hypothetical protein
MKTLWRWLCDETCHPALAAYVLLLAIVFVGFMGYVAKQAADPNVAHAISKARRG